MPSRQTRTAGTVALFSAALWVLAVVVLATSSGFQEGMSGSLIWILPVVSAVATFAVALVGVCRRTGGIRGWWPGATLAVVALGFVLSVIGTWAWPLWGMFLTVAGLLAVLRLRSASLGITTRTRATDWLLVAAWPIGIALSLLLTELHVGPLDVDGDYPVSTALGFGVGAVLFAVSLAQLGRWLRSERPADVVGAPQSVASPPTSGSG